MSDDRRRVSRGRLTLACARLIWAASPMAFVSQAVLAVAGGVTPVLGAVLMRALLMHVVTGDVSFVDVMWIPIVLAVVGVVLATLAHLDDYCQAAASRQVTVTMQAQLHTAVNRMAGLARLEDPGFRDRLRMADQGVGVAPAQLVGGAFHIGQAAITTLGFIAAVSRINPWVIIFVAGGAAPAAFLQFKMVRERMTLLWRQSHLSRRQFFYSDLLIGLDAAKEVRLFGLGGFFMGRMLADLDEINIGDRRMARRQLSAQAVLATTGAIISATGLTWVVYAAMQGRVTVGDLTVFVASIAGIQGSIGSAISQAARMHQALIQFSYFTEIIAEDPDIRTAPVTRPVPGLVHGIEFRDVWFRYRDEHPWVLRGVSLTLPARESVALVGLNGAGKSTLVKLLLRFYEPTRGAIFWDGVDIRELSVSDMRDRIGAVFQDFMKYDLSAADNIAIGDLTVEATPEILAAPARLAGIHDVLAALPRGYHTLLTRMWFDHADKADPDTGVVLSGGQWQRLALARAFLRRDRDLLVLDEPSSGLDAQAEHDIHAAISSYRAHATSLLISHRLGAVRHADRIAVLADGVIAELGNHTALMAAGGAYARLFTLQAKGYALEEVGV